LGEVEKKMGGEPMMSWAKTPGKDERVKQCNSGKASGRRARKKVEGGLRNLSPCDDKGKGIKG